MPSVTANTLIGNAFTVLNVFLPGESVPAADANAGRTHLNLLLDSWRQQGCTVPVINRSTFATVANQGGPSNPYTIGTGGNFNTTKPPAQWAVTGAGLLLNSSSPAVEIPRAVLTDDAWQAIPVKELTNPLFTDVYYNPTYTNNLGTINLWPVPDNADNSLVLYLAQTLTDFADLTTSYAMPDGYPDALTWNLTRRLAIVYGRPLDPEVKQLAINSFDIIKRANLKLTDVPQDLAFLGDNGNRRWGYNIQAGTGGGAS